MPLANHTRRLLREALTSARHTRRPGKLTKSATTEAIDAAVLDVDLDGTPSWDVADALTARSIPFVLATGYSSDDALPERFRSVPKLLKPFSTEGFKAALRALLKPP